MSTEATATGAIAASPGKKDWSKIFLFGGLIFLIISLIGVYMGFTNGKARPAYGLLIMFSFYLSIGLGMLLLTMIHHVFGSGWSTVIRRQLEHGIAIFPWLGLIFVPFLLISYLSGDPGFIWKWFDKTAVETDVLYQAKKWYLGQTRFLISYFMYFGGWIYLAHKLRTYSKAQDVDGDPKWTKKMVFHSAWGIIFTALTLTAASIDWIKAIEFHWFSTMYGVWFFAASMRGALAVVALICLYQIYKHGPLTGMFKRGHLYDLGCIMLAFTVFWAYISFSQYFLIYNANIPEETFWYNMREEGFWWWISMGLVFGHFLFTFIYLLYYRNKIRAIRMIFICCWIITFHMLDLYFNILPSKREVYDMYVPYPFAISVWDITAFLGIGGICAWSFICSWNSSNIIPLKDPRIDESLRHHGR
ncbi:MAG: hypothetical protein CMI18_13520 [Opitutaceae bacterium]|nr:hypothetical protein [Opitutaceae bacterium]|tara:strand:- start:1672 stop:2922 length:1251 start_codon:yes stop_codon:yes gene_type:complete